MSRARQNIILIWTNIQVFVLLLFFANLLAIAAYQGYQFYKKTAGNAAAERLDERAMLPNYQDVDWAWAHFRELTDVRAEYRSYVGWRRLPYSGETITIDAQGLRASHGTAASDQGAPLALFLGGSTMWGEGANDHGTIPSQFAVANAGSYEVRNFGESAYNAFQSYLFLKEQLLSGARPQLIVSYDGVNEVHGRCRAGNTTFGHGREFQIRDAMRDKDRPDSGDGALRLSIFISPLQELIARFGSRMHAQQIGAYDYICHRDPERAQRVAQVLLDSWLTLKKTADLYGARFVAALQPVAYLGAPQTAHLTLDPVLGREYATVYPIIRTLLGEPAYRELHGLVLDLSAAFDGDEHIYIDFCHVSPNGNAIVADLIGRHLAGSGALH